MSLLSMLKHSHKRRMRTAIRCYPHSRPSTLAAALVGAFLSMATTAPAQQSTTIGNLPFALICSKEDVTVIGYLSRVNADGSAVYMTTTNIVVAVSAEGMVNNRAEGTCAGKSLDELRDSGQTRAFPE